VSHLRAAVGVGALEANARALRERAPNTVRPTLGRGGAEAAAASLARDGFVAEPGPHGSLVVTGPGDPFSSAAFRDGLITPQDPASLRVVDLLGDLAGTRVLDLCAGRGVKSTAMADRGAHVVAVDVIAEKLASARRLAERLGVAERIETHVADAAEPTGALGVFDRVLVDAPCTGVGTIRRHPEIAWRREPADVGRAVELQARLLDAAVQYVAPGGLLVYAVCSFVRAEAGGAAPAGLTELGAPEVPGARGWRGRLSGEALSARAVSGRSWLWPRRLAKLEGVTRCPGISMPRALVQLAAALALAGLFASPLGCASNPTPHPAADGSGAFGDEASQPTTADSGVSGDVGGVSDLAAPPADGAADDAAPAPLDVSADGDAATGTDADATVGPDAGCGAAVGAVLLRSRRHRRGDLRRRVVDLPHGLRGLLRRRLPS
jgi:16S rRNA C967 or C1407 C5-methylase (RsmB/RsmF family)